MHNISKLASLLLLIPCLCWADPQLILEAYTDSAPPIYPGERFYVGYRFIYNTPLDLTEEILPLLEAKGLQTIGNLRVREVQEGNWSIQEISQKVEAKVPGTYLYGPSRITGITAKGKILEASASQMTIKVLPFISTHQPPSFHGAVGSFFLQAKLLSPPTVRVGEPLVLELAVSGSEGLQTVFFPSMGCLPGISGLFQASDLPPVGVVDGSTVVFSVTLFPLTSTLQEIPSIDFTSLHPETGEYVTQSTTPIAIHVLPVQKPKELIAEGPPWKEKSIQEVREFESNFSLTSKDLESRPFGSWWTLLLIPYAMAFYWLQFYIRDQRIKRIQNQERKGADKLFILALTLGGNTPAFYSHLISAFLLRLVERGDISTTKVNPENLVREGVVGEVRAFLCDLEADRFSGLVTMSKEEVEKRAKALWDRLKESA